MAVKQGLVIVTYGTLVGVMLLVGQRPVLASDPSLTLSDCYRAALQRSETLADQMEFVIQAEEQYHEIIGNVLPSVSATAAYAREGTGTYRNYFNPGPTAVSAQHLIQLSATQPLFRGFREFAAIRASGQTVHAQKEAKQWAGMQVYVDLVQSFYAVLALEKDLDHIDTEQGLYAQRIHDLNGRMAIGRSRPTEVLTVQTSEAQLAAQREQVLGQLQVAREVLAFLTGLAPEIKLQDTAAVPDAVSPLETYLARLPQRPDLQAAQARVEAARENVTIAANAHLPSVDLSGDYYVDHSEPAPILVWDAQIALTLPVFSGFTLVAKTHQAESQLRQSENDLSQLNRLNLQEIRSDYYNVKSDLSQIAANKAAADMAEKNYRAVLKDYNLGLVTNLDVVVALQSYQDSLRALDKAIFSSKSDFEHLETAAAKRLELYP